VALRCISFRVDRGEIVGLLGRSGSGKTTLFRLITGAIRPTGGSLEVLGAEMETSRGDALRRVRRRLSLVAQQHNLVPGMSVMGNVLMGRIGRLPTWRALPRMLLAPVSERRIAARLARELGVGDKLYDRADDLSGGQQQRIAVARALSTRPELLLADEPVASVDPQTATAVMEALERANRDDGTTLVLSLHQPDLALRYCRRLIVLSEGSIAYDGPAEAIDPTLVATAADHADRPVGEVVHGAI
jgi:phosphonate transport system ATP-binding protein